MSKRRSATTHWEDFDHCSHSTTLRKPTHGPQPWLMVHTGPSGKAVPQLCKDWMSARNRLVGLIGMHGRTWAATDAALEDLRGIVAALRDREAINKTFKITVANRTFELVHESTWRAAGQQAR